LEPGPARRGDLREAPGTANFLSDSTSNDEDLEFEPQNSSNPVC